MFVALYPPEPLVAELSEALTQIKRDTTGADAIRWAEPSQWHLTLAFLPKVADERLPGLAAALSAVGRERGSGPALSVAGCGQFGASTLWWALRSDEVAERWLSQLSREVRRVCRAAGATTDDSRWQPHITVGRVRRGAPAGTARRWADVLSQVTSQTWSPHELVLVTSVTGPVVSHTVTGRWLLAGHRR